MDDAGLGAVIHQLRFKSSPKEVHKKNMLHLVILLLDSACVSLCSAPQRVYYLINEAKGWEEAQSYCRKNYTDLATISSRNDMQRVEEITAASGVTKEIWIGLKKTSEASWLWSVRETSTGQGLVEYTNWASLPDSSHLCGGMRSDGKWLSASCGNEHPFVCQEAFTVYIAIFTEEGKRRYVVLEKKTWRKAEEHCRLNNTDLASVRSQSENQALQHKVGPSLTFLWIGLFRDQWKWSDRSDSSFRYWESSQPNHDGDCALYRPKARWFDRSCTSSLLFLCHKEEKKAERRIVRVEMKSDSLFTFSDSAMNEAIFSQIQNKYEGVKLQWRVQPDGKIFHKKEKREIHDDC